jgi:hypothetical protein
MVECSSIEPDHATAQCVNTRVCKGSCTSVLQAGVLSELRGSLLVGAQYLADCHTGPGEFVAQVCADIAQAAPGIKTSCSVPKL